MTSNANNNTNHRKTNQKDMIIIFFIKIHTHLKVLFYSVLVFLVGKGMYFYLQGSTLEPFLDFYFSSHTAVKQPHKISYRKKVLQITEYLAEF